MCGIAGFLPADGVSGQDSITRVNAMLAAIRHRGPDGEGIWQSRDCRVTLGHRRLSILDLSSNGSQPMLSKSSRYVISYNGEIYNHSALREELEQSCPIEWRGTSDTETLIECFTQWGIDKTLSKINGMFAFALYDQDLRKLHLVRDRLGEKPLYFGVIGRALVFASELKAIVEGTDTRFNLNFSAVSDFLRYNNIPAPKTIYEGIHKLLPGSIVTFDESDLENAEYGSYWSIERAAENGSRNPVELDHAEIVDVLETQLLESVQSRMNSDVPLGAFLSGGVDSSLVVAMMKATGSKSVNTFSIGFEEEAYDEAPYARSVATHLGTQHNELYVSASDAIDVIPNLSSVWDEPFADSSQIPTYLVSKLTRQHVVVSLSGDGGDEMFGGYRRYWESVNIWERLNRVPQVIRSPASRLGAAVLGLRRSDNAANGGRRYSAKVAHWRRLLELASLESHPHLYQAIMSQWLNPKEVFPSNSNSPYIIERFDKAKEIGLHDAFEQMMLCDASTYLHDTIMCKVDRASMAVGLEARAPLLDHQLAELAWRIPVESKLRAGNGKILLKEVLKRHIPNELIERPKKGFSLPVGIWLRGPLREWAEVLLCPKTLEQQGLFNASAVRRSWELHLSGRWDLGGPMWNILMFQSWLLENASIVCVDGSASRGSL